MMHKCKDGTEIKLENMTDSHLINTIEYMFRKASEHEGNYVVGFEEVEWMDVNDILDDVNHDQYILEADFREIINKDNFPILYPYLKARVYENFKIARKFNDEINRRNKILRRK